MSAPPTPQPIAALYSAAAGSFIEFARTLSADDWSTPVICTPGWDVRDVLSHVSGVTDDAFAGRLDGVATETWTASQVERNRGFTVDELIDRWSSQISGFGEVLDAMGEERPPFDCHSHEHDVRHALGRPGNRDSAVIAAAVERIAQTIEAPCPLTIELSDGRSFTCGANKTASDVGVGFSGVTPFELFRSRLGRRARAQVRDYDWTGPDELIDEVIDGWFMFGPSAEPIVE